MDFFKKALIFFLPVQLCAYSDMNSLLEEIGSLSGSLEWTAGQYSEKSKQLNELYEAFDATDAIRDETFACVNGSFSKKQSNLNDILKQISDLIMLKDAEISLLQSTITTEDKSCQSTLNDKNNQVKTLKDDLDNLNKAYHTLSNLNEENARQLINAINYAAQKYEEMSNTQENFKGTADEFVKRARAFNAKDSQAFEDIQNTLCNFSCDSNNQD